MRDSNCFEDPFVMGLKPDLKLLWFYILDRCDHAGVWKTNFMLASMLTGVPQDEKAAFDAMKEKVEVLEGGYWFIPSFLKFQYGLPLNRANKTHASALKILEKYGIDTSSFTTENKPLGSPLEGSKDKDKDMDKVKDPKDSFEDFWKNSWKGPKNGKQEALKAWEHLNPDSTLILELQTKCAAEAKWREAMAEAGEFAPGWKYLQGWLNKRRWEDELVWPQGFKKPDACEHEPDESKIEKVIGNQVLATCKKCKVRAMMNRGKA